MNKESSNIACHICQFLKISKAFRSYLYYQSPKLYTKSLNIRFCVMFQKSVALTSADKYSLKDFYVKKGN